MAETITSSNTEYVRKDVFDARMDRMEALLEKTLIEMRADNERLRGEMAQFRSEVKSDITQLRSDVKSDVDQLRTELKSDIVQLRTEMKESNAQLRTELKSDIEQLRSDMNNNVIRIEGKIETLTARVNDFQHWHDWELTLIGIALAAATIAFTVWQYFSGKRDERHIKNMVERHVAGFLAANAAANAGGDPA